MACAVRRRKLALMPQFTLFHEFHPSGGVAAKEEERERGGAETGWGATSMNKNARIITKCILLSPVKNDDWFLRGAPNFQLV